ncbi:MAG: hypothetical protein PHX61_12785 [Alphaproteobacteria bacterium]|nr:hypothetical protein [Alphaproteobacteria bacterium]
MSEQIIPEMCNGCGWAGKTLCRIIKDPGWFFRHRGACFAKVTSERMREIEKEIHKKMKEKEGSR